MLVITNPVGDVRAAALASRARDTLRLTWEQRRWTRKRVITTAGREVALALPTGSVLSPGDIVAVEPDWYLEIEAEPEPVIAVHPRSRAEAIRVAYEVGNHHFSLAIDGDALLIPDDTAMEHLVMRLGVAWERRRAVYCPVGGRGQDGDRPHRHG